jgi:hypothetical protein
MNPGTLLGGPDYVAAWSAWIASSIALSVIGSIRARHLRLTRNSIG